MIKGLGGYDLQSLAAAFTRARGKGGPVRGTMPVPGHDTLQTRPAPGQRPGPAQRPDSPQQPAHPAKPVQAGGQVTRPVEANSMMERMRAAFMSVEGDDRFAADLDLHADGRIDLKDLAALRHQLQPARPVKPAHDAGQVTRPAEPDSIIQRMRAAFMSVEGDDRFSADLDLHADGRIDLKDLAALRDQQQPASNEQMLQRMRASFLLSAGDDGFDATVDLNRDGRVDLADMVVLRSRMDATTPVPPPEPAAGKPAVEQVSNAAHNAHANHPDVMQSIRESFMTRQGDDAYSAVADLNADGAVDLLDLAEWRSRNHEA